MGTKWGRGAAPEVVVEVLRQQWQASEPGLCDLIELFIVTRKLQTTAKPVPESSEPACITTVIGKHWHHPHGVITMQVMQDLWSKMTRTSSPCWRQTLEHEVDLPSGVLLPWDVTKYTGQGIRDKKCVCVCVCTQKCLWRMGSPHSSAQRALFDVIYNFYYKQTAAIGDCFLVMFCLSMCRALPLFWWRTTFICY